MQTINYLFASILRNRVIVTLVSSFLIQVHLTA